MPQLHILPGGCRSPGRPLYPNPRTILGLSLSVIVLVLGAACSAEPAATQNPAVSPTQNAPLVTETSPSEATSPTAALPSNTPAATDAQPSATTTPPTINTPAETESPETSVPALPSPQTAAWQPVASGLDAPIGIAAPPDGSGRLFVLEQAGKIRILQEGNLLPDPFLDISENVGCCGERGLLGLAFHPRYPENGYFYVNYTNRDGDTVISRFQVTEQDPNLASEDSEIRLLFVPQPYPNHNGGALVFGPDGYLYLGLGDGGSGGDPQGNGQSTETVLGKILRVDVDGGEPYAIPADNPFAANGRGTPEIFAYGLRNPWRIAFDSLTGDLYIADVGQNAYEEINFLAAGSLGEANFGWSYREGAHSFQGNPPDGLELIEPVAEYSHSDGCSVTGGAVYRGAELPDWQGVYLFGDYCSGKLWGLLRTADGSWQQALLYETGFNITSFGEDQSGEVYLTDYSGTVYRLTRAQ